jgi:hypothetical protein
MAKKASRNRDKIMSHANHFASATVDALKETAR